MSNEEAVKSNEDAVKSNEEAENQEIECISGDKKVLLIAPHGYNDENDDENTGELTRRVAKQIGCYAVINEIYRKPKQNEKPNKKNKIINLNNITQVEKHLKKDFLDALMSYKDQITEQHGNALVLWIHGAENLNVINNVPDEADFKPEDVKVLVGFGQKTDDNRFTAKKETVDNLIKLLTDNDLTAILANPDKDSKKYCGWDKNNMNQLFRSDKYSDGKVQSIQLEFRKDGCRDDESVEQTAKALAEAISSVADTMTADGPQVSLDPTDSLVEEVFQHLKNKFSKTIPNTMLESGIYLITKLYGGDYEMAQKNKDNKKSSLAKLIKKIQEDTEGNCPSRTWIYNSFNLAIDQKFYSEGSLASEYSRLGHSHKVKLLNVIEESDKKKLIRETVKKGYTVAKLLERIKKVNHKDEIPVDKEIPEEQLESLDLEKLNKIKTKTVTLKNSTQKKLDIYEINLTAVNKVIEIRAKVDQDGNDYPN